MTVENNNPPITKPQDSKFSPQKLEKFLLEVWQEAETASLAKFQEVGIDITSDISALCGEISDQAKKEGADSTINILKSMAEKEKNGLAQLCLGFCYRYGCGVEKNTETAMAWYTKAAEGRYGVAQLVLGLMYEGRKGMGIVPEEPHMVNNMMNRQLALQWYTEASKHGVTLPKLLREAHEAVRKEREEFEGLLRIADSTKGGTTVDDMIAQIYHKGGCDKRGGLYTKRLPGGVKNFELARKYYLKASQNERLKKKAEEGLNELDAVEVAKLKAKAEKGDSDAQYYMGFCYENGIGVEKDAGEAVRRYQLSAERGHLAAQYRLANCYEKGSLGVKQDLSKAQALYEQAYIQGYSLAGKQIVFSNSTHKQQVEAKRKAVEEAQKKGIENQKGSGTGVSVSSASFFNNSNGNGLGERKREKEPEKPKNNGTEIIVGATTTHASPTVPTPPG